MTTNDTTSRDRAVTDNGIALGNVQYDLRSAASNLQQAAAELLAFAEALADQIRPEDVDIAMAHNLVANTSMKAQSVSHSVHRTTDHLLTAVQHMADLNVVKD